LREKNVMLEAKYEALIPQLVEIVRAIDI